MQPAAGKLPGMLPVNACWSPGNYRERGREIAGKAKNRCREMHATDLSRRENVGAAVGSHAGMCAAVGKLPVKSAMPCREMQPVAGNFFKLMSVLAKCCRELVHTTPVGSAVGSPAGTCTRAGNLPVNAKKAKIIVSPLPGAQSLI